MPLLRPSGPLAASALAMFVLAASAADRAAVAQQAPLRPVSLTRPAAIASPRTARPLDPWEQRSRLVSLNAGSLVDRTSSGVALAANRQIVIDLFDGVSVTAVFDHFDSNNTGVTWVGRVPDQPGSLVTLVEGSGVLTASIRLSNASYTIRPAPRDPADPAADAESVHVLVQINDAGFPTEAPPIVPEISTQAIEAAAEVSPTADTAEFIDVLIVYTALAETWAGGQGGIVNWINLSVSETNSAYAASGVNQRVRLVHTERVAFTETNNLSPSLSALRAGSPGLEIVPALRDAYTADLVSLFVRPVSPDFGGIAYLMTSVTTAFAPSGFSVVHTPSAPLGTLAHEFGHNMGLRHDWYMDAGTTPFTYAHGYVNLAAGFRTIMAYPNACTAAGVVCTRLQAFSNPDLTHLGQPMGVAGGTNTSCPTSNASNMSCDADERRALNNTALTVANFREFSSLRPPLIRTHPQNQSVARGQALTLEVAADGLGPLTYQWYRGMAPGLSQPIAGATNPAYTFVPGADGVWLERWYYWARVSNSIGPANSNTAVITIGQPGADANAPQRRFVDRLAGPGGRTAGGAARPRPGLETGPRIIHPGLLWLLEASEREIACTAARVDAELAWETLAERSGDVSELMATLERLVRAVAVLQEPACQFAGGGRP